MMFVLHVTWSQFSFSKYTRQTAVAFLLSFFLILSLCALIPETHFVKIGAEHLKKLLLLYLLIPTTQQTHATIILYNHCHYLFILQLLKQSFPVFLCRVLTLHFLQLFDSPFYVNLRILFFLLLLIC